jgi:transcriptional regulator with XRE-family HTH domain
MAFQRDRLKGLLTVKKIRPDEVAGFPRGTISNWLNGHSKPSDQAQCALALALDATMDYFHAVRDDYGDDYERAAREMSFDIFEKDISVDLELRKRCRRIRGHVGAPQRVADWKVFADLIQIICPPQQKYDVIMGGK